MCMDIHLGDHLKWVLRVHYIYFADRKLQEAVWYYFLEHCLNYTGLQCKIKVGVEHVLVGWVWGKWENYKSDYSLKLLVITVLVKASPSVCDSSGLLLLGTACMMIIAANALLLAFSEMMFHNPLAFLLLHNCMGRSHRLSREWNKKLFTWPLTFRRPCPWSASGALRLFQTYASGTVCNLQWATTQCSETCRKKMIKIEGNQSSSTNLVMILAVVQWIWWCDENPVLFTSLRVTWVVEKRRCYSLETGLQFWYVDSSLA